MKTGAIAIAAITSCTNTSNPYVLIGAGLVAKKASELGMKVPNYVKTSLAPGSKVVTGYLVNSGLLPYLKDLGFNIVGYGCTTCIGNSGPLEKEIEDAVSENDLLITSVLSGNRNFEGRIHPLVKGNYLASPPLVVAYALAGTVNIDLTKDPIGVDKNGENVISMTFGHQWMKSTASLKALSHLSYSVQSMKLFLTTMNDGMKLKRRMMHCTNGMKIPHTLITRHSLKTYQLNLVKLNRLKACASLRSSVTLSQLTIFLLLERLVRTHRRANTCKKEAYRLETLTHMDPAVVTTMS
ncbi:hypothetical protein BsIDN1_33490 [Bacillus safensis]|uniref:aconitate hydratase n=1 Tax=Bacillus safensis TaxID=561879 RepID=A0A5S9MA01_BACIA|nr:hypothetical protein BsIDN1_33490 [Bacillus safensis]